MNFIDLIHKEDFNNAISRHSSTLKGVSESYKAIKEMVENVINGEIA